MREQAEWASIHVFYYGNQDDLLVHGVRPLFAGLSEETRIFFLRYWLGGPHIRVRVTAPPPTLETEAKEVWARLEDYLAVHPSTAPFTVADIGAVQERLAALEGVAPDVVVPDNTLRMARYLPEFGKYGGPQGVRVAEALFCESSALVLDVLPGVIDRPARREWLALEMLLAAVHAVKVTVSATAEFLAFYSQIWSRYVFADERRRWDEVEARHQATIDAIVARAHLDAAPVSRRWADAVRGAESLLDAPILSQVAVGGRLGQETDRRNAVLAQFLHTHHNRLGLHPRQEAFLAHVAYRSLTHAEERGPEACVAADVPTNDGPAGA